VSIDSAIEAIRCRADQAYGDNVLRGLQAPDPALWPDQPEAGSGERSGLFALHLGAAFHRRAIIVDVMLFYRNRARLEAADYPSLALVGADGDGNASRESARACYAAGIALAPDLAEIRFNLARLDQLDGNREAALAGFETALGLTPHADASPHAHMEANAHWESATLLEDLGRDAEALAAYRKALANLASFGVHHQRAARFFRKMNCLDESIAEFRKGMGYSHRYFAEFVLPPLTPAAAAASPALQPVYETTGGETVVLWQGAYYALPAAMWQSLDDGAESLSETQMAGARHAVSIARLENPA